MTRKEHSKACFNLWMQYQIAPLAAVREAEARLIPVVEAAAIIARDLDARRAALLAIQPEV